MSGVIDAVSFLRLGHVFVANMTGNVVFLGFALAGATDARIAALVVSIAAFLAGSLAGGVLGRRSVPAPHLIGIATAVMLLPTAVACAIAFFANAASEPVRIALVTLLSAAMGLQNAAARKIAVPDLTTTVLTLTLTGLGADARFAGGDGARTGRRIAAVATMLAGAFGGAVALGTAGIGAVLAGVTLALAAVSALSLRLR